MGNYISFQINNIKYIIIIASFIVMSFISLFLSNIIDDKIDDKSKDSRLMKPFLTHVFMCLAYIPEIIIARNISSEGGNSSRKIYKTNKVQFFLISTFASFLVLINGSFLILSERFNKERGTKIMLSNFYFFGFIVIVLISIFIFKSSFYKHQFLSILMIILFGVIRYILKYFINEGINKKGPIYEITDFILQMITYTLLALYLIFCKIIIEKYYISGYKCSYVIGLINIPLTLIFYFIMSYIPCNEQLVCAIQYKKKYYLDNIFDFFNTVKNFSNFLIILIYHGINGINFILFNMIIEEDTICHMFLPYQIKNYFKTIREFGWDIIKDPMGLLVLISFILETIVSLVFLEIIELKFWGLNRDTKFNIQQRATLDSNQLRLDSIEMDGYIVDYNNSLNYGKKKN